MESTVPIAQDVSCDGRDRSLLVREVQLFFLKCAGKSGSMLGMHQEGIKKGSLLGSYLDFRFKWFVVPVLVLVLICTFWCVFPEHWGYENGVLETLQLVFLLGVWWLCRTAKEERPLFHWLAWFVVILALREVNCGRTLFFPVPGEPNTFLKWNQIPYGWVVKTAYIIFVVGVCFRFIWIGGFKACWRLLTQRRMPVWNVLLLLLAVLISYLSEHVFGLMMLEELGECTVYGSMGILAWLYGRGELMRRSQI